LKSFPEVDPDWEIDTDLTELLNVKQWYAREIDDPAGQACYVTRPSAIPKSDETRLQSSMKYLQMLEGNPYYITTKIDGTACYYYLLNGEIGVCSRRQQLIETEGSLYWRPFHKYSIKEKLESIGKNICIQGELFGPTIQGNKLNVSEVDYNVYDVYDLDTGRSYVFEDLKRFCADSGLKMVPIEEVGESFHYTLEELLLKAQGKYPKGRDKEGIVVRSTNIPVQRISFKVLNNVALAKEKD
jgi:RNA ligase (TIGR02306 family)